MHKGDFTDAIRSMCETIEVIRLEEPEQIVAAYMKAYYTDHSTVLVEVSDFLDESFRNTYKKFRKTYRGK